MSTPPKSIEEGVAALAEVLSDADLDAATAGEYGNDIRLLTLSEKVRRSQSGSAA